MMKMNSDKDALNFSFRISATILKLQSIAKYKTKWKRRILIHTERDTHMEINKQQIKTLTQAQTDTKHILEKYIKKYYYFCSYFLLLFIDIEIEMKMRWRGRKNSSHHVFFCHIKDFFVSFFWIGGDLIFKIYF